MLTSDDDDRHLRGDRAQRRRDLGQQAIVAPHLHHPAELAHHRPEHLEHVEADAAHVVGPAAGGEQVEAQPAHAEPVPRAQGLRLDAGVGDGDAAQPPAMTRERIEHDAVVVAVGVALHDDAAREAETVEQRQDSRSRPGPPAGCSRGRARTGTVPPGRRRARGCPMRRAAAACRAASGAAPDRRSAAVGWIAFFRVVPAERALTLRRQTLCCRPGRAQRGRRARTRRSPRRHQSPLAALSSSFCSNPSPSCPRLSRASTSCFSESERNVDEPDIDASRLGRHC